MSKPIRDMVDIPITAAKRIAEDYGYDQVVIMARRCHTTPEPHGEHVTTYGRTVDHCRVAAMMGDKLKHLGLWFDVDVAEQKIAELEARIRAQDDEINNLKIEILEYRDRDEDFAGDAWERDTKS